MHIEYYILNAVGISYEDGVKSYTADIPSQYLGKSWILAIHVSAHGPDGPSSAQDWFSWAEAYITGRYVADLEATPNTVELTQGESRTIHLSLSGDFPGPLYLSVEGLPTGVSASFSSDVISKYAPSKDLTLTASDDAETGTFDVTVKAQYGSYMTTTATISLKVNPKAQPDFTIDVSPDAQTVTKGVSNLYSRPNSSRRIQRHREPLGKWASIRSIRPI